ncbi:hypothetical protein N7X57_15770 [Lactiplantibacillus paraplantarum]|nr:MULTISPECIES: hypothetical protein [Lactiplantibacillus]MCG0678284.1 hypothetical protein [Lactiplantibacillus plantarum]MCW1911865.1 hypothetical protein [Lactiplantibacillus paraplantarum]USZ62447.1 hypothetical protein NHN12_15975 [Lactiplantibacillus plantarum]
MTTGSNHVGVYGKDKQTLYQADEYQSLTDDRLVQVNANGNTTYIHIT